MADERTVRSRAVMDEALAKVISDLDPDASPRFLMGYYVIAQYSDAEGKVWLTRFADEDSTAWSRMGMLAFAENEEQRAANEEDG